MSGIRPMINLETRARAAPSSADPSVNGDRLNCGKATTRARRGLGGRFMKTDQDRTIVQLLAFQPRGSRTMDVFLLRLAEALAERGWKTVHVFSGDPPEAFRTRLEAIGSPYFRADFPIDWHRTRSLAPLLQPFSPQILQTTFMSFFSPPLWWLKRAIGAKHWVVADHTSGRCSPRRGLKGAAARLQAAAAARFIDRVVAVSDFVARRDVEQHMLPRRIVQTIYNGVDTRRFHPAGHRPEGDRPPTIVFVGQLIPEKGVDLLIEATKRLSQGAERPPALKIAGAGRERSWRWKVSPPGPSPARSSSSARSRTYPPSWPPPTWPSSRRDGMRRSDSWSPRRWRAAPR